MQSKTERWIKEHEKDILESIRENVRIKSVEEPSDGEGAPFGKGVKMALENALETARKLGLKTSNLDGYAGCVDYGEGDEMLGIICHLDVVPEGEGWTYPPYGAEIAEGKLFGRGTMDDKGPAICAIYALAAVKEAGTELRRRVRIILGTNEETGWGCMNHYRKVERIPDISFSPDAEYPVVNSEKSIYHCDFSSSFKSRITVKGGTRANVVCGRCELFVPVDINEIQNKLAPVLEKGFTADLEAMGEGTRIIINGLDAHASTPEQGKNAMQAAFALLCSLPLEGEDERMAHILNCAFAFDMHGESMGLDVEDESGRLTLNPGVIDWDNNGIKQLSLDIRHPISLEQKTVLEHIEGALKEGDFKLISEKIQKGLYVSADSELVSRLLEVYEKRTGDRLEPLAIGGGTYARAFPNAVAFGCERPGVPVPIHMPDEFIEIGDIAFNANMIADAIIALASK